MANVVGQLGESEVNHPAQAASVDWQTELRRAVRDPAELCRLLELPESLAVEAVRAGDEFPLLVPRTYLSRIQSGNPLDPLLLQVLPQAVETETRPGFSDDPLGEAAILQPPGLLAKYAGRSLMVTTGACGVHCRFCFRRHFPYSPSFASLASWEPVISRVEADQSVREMILSGGEPLSLSDGLLAQLARRLAAVPHLARLRVHTRLPIVIPQRVTDELLAWLRATRLTPVVVVHVNHPREIDDAVADALGRLVDAGVPVLSQSVLLRRVNDEADTLAALFERLVDLRVMPYYLHQLDAVAGAAHFEVPEATGRAILQALRDRLPGYAVPRYVRETPGERSKQWVEVDGGGVS